MTDMLQWIDSQIDELQREIVKLTLAREVFIRASKQLKPERVSTPRKPAQKRERNGVQVTEIRRHIIDCLSERSPASPKDVGRYVIGKLPGVRAKAVWNQLYLMKVRQTIIHDKDSATYRLPGETRNAA